MPFEQRIRLPITIETHRRDFKKIRVLVETRSPTRDRNVTYANETDVLSPALSLRGETAPYDLYLEKWTALPTKILAKRASARPASTCLPPSDCGWEPQTTRKKKFFPENDAHSLRSWQRTSVGLTDSVPRGKQKHRSLARGCRAFRDPSIFARVRGNLGKQVAWIAHILDDQHKGIDGFPP